MTSKFKRILKVAFSENAIIPWMMVVAIMPMILISYIAYDIARQSLRLTIDNNLRAAIHKKVEVIDDYISQRKLYLLQLSELPNLSEIIQASEKNGVLDMVDKTKIKPLSNYLRHFSHRLGIANIYIVSTQGKVVYTLNADPLLGQVLSETDAEDVALFHAINGSQILLMPYLYSNYHLTAMGESHIYIANPVHDDRGLIKAVLVIKLTPTLIANVINRYVGYGKSEETLLATMQHDEPVVVMHTQRDDDAEITDSHNPELMTLLKRAIRGESGGPVEVTFKHKSLLAIYRYVPQLNMGMLIHYQTNEVFERINRLKTNMLALIGLGLLVVISIVLWISRQLWRANVKSDRLLTNILPKFVIDELKEKKTFAARNVHNVSILFADVVNFTAFSSSTSPDNVVRFLDELFSIFDNLAHKHQVEKIKTIGDGYMVAAGLTAVQQDHANRIVEMGLDMIAAIKHYNIDHHTHFGLRIGVDSGTVTTGIIGTKKFSYDLWGHAVNLASRMELTALENTVQLTADTYQALQHQERYIITPRHGVMVKGIGELDTFLVEGRVRMPKQQG